jgi:hypothetical protein
VESIKQIEVQNTQAENIVIEIQKQDAANQDLFVPTIDEAVSLYADDTIKLYQHLKDFELSDAQINMMNMIPVEARPKIAKKRLLEYIKQNHNERSKHNESLAEDAAIQRTLPIQEYMIANEIVYVARSNVPFVMFESTTKEIGGWNRAWAQIDESTFKKQFREYAVNELNEPRMSVDSLIKNDKYTIPLSDVALGCGRYYNSMKSTNRTDIPRNVFNRLAVERKYWITESDEFAIAQPIISDGISVLIKSIAGGKQENFDHICQVLLWKLKKVGDSTRLPALVIYGAEGSGKGIFSSKLLATTTTGTRSSVDMKVQNLDGFNSAMEGANFVVFNESDQDKSCAAKVKKVIGSDTITIEKKGVDAYEVDNTALYIFNTNDAMSSISLSRNFNENRRFSIIHADHSLIYWVKKKLNCDDGEAIDWINNEIIPDCEDRQIVANAIKWMQETYWNNMMRCPKALHGEDYSKLFDKQESSKTSFVQELVEAMLRAGHNVARKSDLIEVIQQHFEKDRIHENHALRMIESYVAANVDKFIGFESRKKFNSKDYRNVYVFTVDKDLKFCDKNELSILAADCNDDYGIEIDDAERHVKSVSDAVNGIDVNWGV